MGNTEIKFAEPRFVTDLQDCFFYHTMTLPTFGDVHAHWDLRGRFDEYIGGVDLKDRSVIDIGTATGFLSFEAEKRGASRVVSFDMAHAGLQTFLPFKDKLHYIDPGAWSQKHNIEVERWKNAYWLCHRLLESKAQVYYGDIHNLPLELGQFDVAILGSVLEHLSDPIRALASISKLVRRTIVVVTPLIDSDDPMASFEGRAANPQQDFTWWTYTRGLYREVLQMLGFSIKAITSGEYFYDYGHRHETRFTIVAERMSDA